MTRTLLFASLFALSFAACGVGPEDDTLQDETTSLEQDLATTFTVTITGTSFSPANLTIKKGSKVKFVNSSGFTHTVTNGTGSAAADAGTLFDKVLKPGKSVTLSFSKLGSFPYFCRPHEAMGMKGSITVTK